MRTKAYKKGMKVRRPIMKKTSKGYGGVKWLLGAMDGAEKVAIRAASLIALGWVIFKILEYHLQN
jgi:hypothetical protein